MKLFHIAKDGGPQSNVTGYWLIESKKYFSIVLLKFSKGSREAYHNHAFNAVSWILKGEMHEHIIYPDKSTEIVKLVPSFTPLYTSKERLHKVYGIANNTWALSFRGPWVDKWKEYFSDKGTFITLTHGRRIV